MPFNDNSLTDLRRTQSAIGALKTSMDVLSFTSTGIPAEAHDLLAVLESRESHYLIVKLGNDLNKTGGVR